MKTYTQQEVRQRAEHILNMPASLRYGTINEIQDMADGGKPVVIAAPDSPASEALREIAENVMESAGGKSVSLPVITG